MPLISIIIPVFNNLTEEIQRCINSLYDEDFVHKVEIILIDDGSRAECANYLDEIALSYSNIKVFHQPNKGVSNARNKGITFATGKYVAFVDADDMVTKCFIPNAIFLLENTNEVIDIIYGFVEYVKNSNENKLFRESSEHNKHLEWKVLSEKEKELLSCHFFDISVPQFLWSGCYISRGPVARLIKRELLIQHKFDETLKIGEDSIWNLELLKFADNLYVVKQCWYFYIYNPKSATQQLSEKEIKQYETMILKYTEFANSEERKVRLINRIFQAANELAKGYFLKEDKFDNVFIATRKFNEMFSRVPWKQALCFSYAYRVGTKCLLKCVLAKIGVLLFAMKAEKLINDKILRK